MPERVHHHPNLIFSLGTQIVTLVDIRGAGDLIVHPRGAVGVVVKAPIDHDHSYRIRFLDGLEVPLKPSEITMLALFKEGEIGERNVGANIDLYERVIYRCVIGSQAYGLSDTESDVDRRGIYLPTAEQHWSLYGVPEQLENDATQEAYWELQKFLVLALKATPPEPLPAELRHRCFGCSLVTVCHGELGAATRGHLVTRDSESFSAKTRPPRGTLAFPVDFGDVSPEPESAARIAELTQVLAGKAENEKKPSALALGVFW
ncbi:MAG: hypothetical protein EXR98_08535 [Gemmataceae bacterium]|nr:hypothetical protein [Gemmataceae bacterium]